MGRQISAVGEGSTGQIYRFAINGENGTTEGTTTLGEANKVFQSWIVGGRVVVPNFGSGTVGVRLEIPGRRRARESKQSLVLPSPSVP